MDNFFAVAQAPVLGHGLATCELPRDPSELPRGCLLMPSSVMIGYYRIYSLLPLSPMLLLLSSSSKASFTIDAQQQQQQQQQQQFKLISRD
eukprot:1145447-Pelagomonas_calceolata.AAC.10